MSIERMTLQDLKASELSRAESATIVGGSVQEISLTRVACDSATRARPWHVTLGRLNRADNRPAVVEGAVPSAILRFPSAQYQYYAGFQQGGAVVPIQPARQNPVWPEGQNMPYVQIVWGTRGGAPFSRLLAHWPALGSSITVYGTDVEVYGGMDQRDLEDPNPDTYPRFQAHVAAAAGVGYPDNELSLVQPFNAGADDVVGNPGGVLYIPDHARRVRIARRDELSNPSVIVFGKWYDDTGTIVDAFKDNENLFSAPYHPVPAAATMLKIVALAVPAPEAYVAHWRISP